MNTKSASYKISILLLGLILCASIVSAAWWGTSTYRRPIDYLSQWVTPINTSTTYTATDIDNDLTSEWIYAYNCSLNNLSIYYNTSSDIKGIANGTNDECFWFQTLPTLDWKHGAAPSNLILYMPLDNSETEVIDFSSYEHNGTIVNSVTQGRTGKIGKSTDFDGSNDYVSIGNDADFTATKGHMTICAWAETDVQDLTATIFGRCSAVGGWAIGTSTSGSGKWKINIGGSTIVYSNSAPQVGLWTHICGRWESSGLIYLFVNGVKQTDSDYYVDAITQSYDVRLGVCSDNTRDYNGRIDDVRYYNAALTDAQILEIYQMGSITGDYESSSSPALSIDWEWDVKNTTITDSNTTACINGSVSMNSCSLFFNNSQYSNTTAGTQICFNIDNLNDTNYTSVNASCTAGNTTEITSTQWLHVNNESQTITWDWSGANNTVYNTEVSPQVWLSEKGNCTLYFNGTMLINTTIGRSISWNRQALASGNYSSINASCDDYALTETNSTNAWVNIESGVCITPIDGVSITEDAVLCAGTYSLTDVGNNGLIRVDGSSITIRGNGTIITQMDNGNHTTIFDFAETHTGIVLKNMTLEVNTTTGRGYYFAFDNDVRANISDITTNGTGATLFYGYDDDTHINFVNCSFDHTNPTYGEVGFDPAFGGGGDGFLPPIGSTGNLGKTGWIVYFINTTMTTAGRYDSTNYTGFATSSYFYHQWWHNANVTNAGVANVSVYTSNGTKLYSDYSVGGETADYLLTTARVTGDYDAGEATPEGNGYTIWYAPLQIIAFANNTIGQTNNSLVGNNQSNVTLEIPFSFVYPSTADGAAAPSGYLTTNVTSNFTMGLSYVETGGTNTSMDISGDGLVAYLVGLLPAYGTNYYTIWAESEYVDDLWLYSGNYSAVFTPGAGGGGGGGATGTPDNFVLYRQGGEAACIGQPFCYNSLTYDSTQGNFQPIKIETCDNRVLAARDGKYTVCNIADHPSTLSLSVDGYSTSFGATEVFLKLNTTTLDINNGTCKSFQVEADYPEGAMESFLNSNMHPFTVTITGVQKTIDIPVASMSAECPSIDILGGDGICVAGVCASPILWFVGLFGIVVLFLVVRR